MLLGKALSEENERRIIFKQKIHEFEEVSKEFKIQNEKDIEDIYKVDDNVAKLDENYSYKKFKYDAQKEYEKEVIK